MRRGRSAPAEARIPSKIVIPVTPLPSRKQEQGHVQEQQEIEEEHVPVDAAAML